MKFLLCGVALAFGVVHYFPINEFLTNDLNKQVISSIISNYSPLMETESEDLARKASSLFWRIEVKKRHFKVELYTSTSRKTDRQTGRETERQNDTRSNKQIKLITQLVQRPYYRPGSKQKDSQKAED
jgi:hypothetical protein